MTTKHTPGPWFCTKAKHGVDGGHYAIAVIGDDRGDRALVIHAAAGDDRQAEGNAQLFLAAPALLNVAQWARDAMRQAFDEVLESIPEGGVVPPWMATLETTIADAEHAIAKAKGEQA